MNFLFLLLWIIVGTASLLLFVLLISWLIMINVDWWDRRLITKQDPDKYDDRDGHKHKWVTKVDTPNVTVSECKRCGNLISSSK